MDPKISVVMPVWNGEKYLREAVESVLQQSFTDFEFIAVDDGSTDSTGAILESYKDPRLRVMRRKHAGLVDSLNFGVATARAEWVARQDADDISLPRRLETLWKARELRSRPIAIHSDVERIAEGGFDVSTAVLPKSHALLALQLCFKCPITHSSVMFQKSAFERAGGYLQEEYYAEDFGLWGRLVEVGPFIGLKDKLVRFRVHAASFTKNLTPAQFEVAPAVAVRHCQKFLGLDGVEARRAFEILGRTHGPRKWKQWGWFLTECAPRTRWKSPEMLAWLSLQTARLLYSD